MTNQEIKRAGHRAVIRYERRRGRAARVTEARGWDILSGRGRGVRHIEVKSTVKKRAYVRSLTPQQVRALEADPRWYLYVVCDVGLKPRVCVFEGTVVRKRLRVSKKYKISFRSTDLDNCDAE